ncbi:Alpha/beta-hydrolase [Mycena venus]|uniref:Alpha/beta-hydrolase n=1 Tax=Mycena venus TaxID=2733690 RepID=A0A8H6YDC7_9AGAR|nr:Alpha/beta-hydrolase [Mycena venus]
MALHSATHPFTPALNIEPFVLDSPPTPSGKPLRVAAKRYRSLGKIPQDGITLLLFHGLGQHKEQWEPALEKLFTLHSERSNLPRIREAWALDWQSHGEAAVLNEDALKDDPKSAPLDLWASAIAGFLKSDLVAGHRLVGVGYSSGTVGLMLSTLAVFSEHALKRSKDKDGNACVVGKCPAIHEASAFQVNLKNTWDAVEQLSKLSQLVPIHVVYGENVDLMPQVIHDCVIKRIGTAASITTVPDVGHTIMQERPDVVATTISEILNHNQD